MDILITYEKCYIISIVLHTNKVTLDNVTKKQINCTFIPLVLVTAVKQLNVASVDLSSIATPLCDEDNFPL